MSNKTNGAYTSSTPNDDELAEALYQWLRKIGQFVWGESGKMYFWKYEWKYKPTWVYIATESRFEEFVLESVKKSSLRYGGREHRLTSRQFDAVVLRLLSRARASLVQSLANMHQLDSDPSVDEGA